MDALEAPVNGLRKMLTLKAGLVAGLLLGALAITVIGLRMDWRVGLAGSMGGWFWLVLLLFLVAAATVVLLWWLPHWREKRFLARLQTEAGKTPEETLEESRRQLREKMLEAIGTLQRSPNLQQQGGMPLYVLPWYLLLGASQSGKTALLQGVANLFTPFVRPASTAGTPTQNCDWWFFNTAIILDTSSRYTLPIQVEHDSAEWYRLLQLLKHYRTQQPVNGLLLAVAADTLAVQAPEELRLVALELRKRVDETIRELGVDAPIYLLITRCDLLEGFTEFCGCLLEQTLKQVFGFMNETRPHNGQQPHPASGQHFESMFVALVTRLQQLRLSIYNQEKLPPVAWRQKIFCFPEEFAALQQPLSVFVETLFAENPVQRTPFLRGLFFCSAQQQGTPFSFVRRELSFESQGTPLKAESRTYFLHDLFAVLLLRERYLVQPTVEARRGWLLRHLSGFAACVALCLLLIVLLSWAFVSDRAAYASAAEAQCALATQGTGTEVLLDQAESCRQTVQTLMDRNLRRPAWSKLVSDRSGRREAWLRQQYVKKFEAEVLTPLDTAIGQLLTASSEPIALVFLLFKRLDLLKHCLSAAGCPHSIQEKMSPDYQLMLSAAWQRPVLPEQVTRLGNAYAAYLRWPSGAKEALRREQEAHAKRLRHWFSSRQLALSQLLLWANQHYAPVTLQEYWEESPGTGNVPTSQVAGAYTRAAWEKSILPFLQRAPETVPDMQPLLGEFVAAYRTQSFDQWQRFLTDFPLGEFAWAGTRESRRRLALKLLEPGSAYNRVLEATFEHLQPLLPAAVDTSTPVPSWVRVLSRYASSESRKAYLETLKETGKQLAGELTGETSFQLVRTGFQEGKPTEKSTHPLLRAWWIVDQFHKQQGSSEAAEAAALWPLLQRPLHFVWNMLLEETGLYLQERWHELLLEVQDLPVGQKHEVLYGKGGKVVAFVSGPAAAFLERRGEEYLRKRLADAAVAFTDPFLFYLKRARVGWPQPEFDDAKRRVQVSVAPADIQAEGDVKVARTELILDCDSGRQSLGTANARGDFPFVWTVKGCFNTALRISLSDASGQELASLERRYPGFPQFLEHFHSFQQVFRLTDFAVENGAQLAPHRIRTLTLRYRFPPEARQQLVKDLEAYKRYEENLQARLELPATIVATPQ